MRISAEMIVTIALLGCCSCFGVVNTIAQTHLSTTQLVQKLQSDKTTDEARKQLMQLGKSNPDARHYLAAQLPPLIELGPKSCPPSEIGHSCPWYNAVELAGNLKIGEASSALAPWLNWRSPGPSGLSLEARLIFYPAARALAEIGDPAIPVVQPALDHGNADEHFAAVRVLCIIHTPKAKAVLRDDLQHETDLGLQTMVKNCLR